MPGVVADPSTMSIMEQIALLDVAEQIALLDGLTELELADFRLWLRPSQLAVLHDAAPIVLDARGRGAGKTRVGATWTIEKARTPGTRIHVVGRTVADARDVMVTGESGILAVSPPDFVPDYVPSVRKLIWPNGSQAMTFSADAPDALRGPQAHATWCDELAAWKQKPDSSGATAWDNVLISTRLGANPQVLVTTTPRRVRVVRGLIKEAKKGTGRVSMHIGSTLENAANLSPEYISNLLAMYAGTALEQQEIYGLYLEEVAGALWRDSDFVIGKWADEIRDQLVTVIGVDPGVTTGGDATGISVVRGTTERVLEERRAWVVSDETEPGLSPDRWAARVVRIWQEQTALMGRPAVVVAEKNQGGELVSTVIRQSPGGENVPVALIHAKGSKAARAEPVVLMYRRKRVEHIDEFDELTEELTTWEPEVSTWSPNRMDAMVHALRAIFVNDEVLSRFGSLQVLEPSIQQVTIAGWRGSGTGHTAYVDRAPAWRDGRERK